MINRWLTHNKTLIIGHRGAKADAPENTLKAFALAQAQGADGIEFDMRLAADGVPVVIHDATVDRTTNGSGYVADMSSAELATLNAGDGEPIPTLDQLFETCGRDFLYNLEIKDYGPFGSGTEEAISACIGRHNLAKQTLVSSFDQHAMFRAQATMPHGVVLALIRMSDLPPHPGWLTVQADHPYFDMVDAAYMAWANANNYRVHVWTVDDLAEVQRLTQLGVHALITNNPKVMVN